MTCDETRPLLSALRDGELDAAQKAAVESHLGTCALCRNDLERMADLGDAIRGSRLEAPAHLRQNVVFALRSAAYVEQKQRPIQRKQWSIAAAALLVTGLASAPFIVNARNGQQALATELVSAHERALAGREMDVVSTDRHTVKPWFNGKLPFAPPVVDFAEKGFPLEGGRLDYIGGRPVAALVYTRRLHRIDVFVWPEGSAKPPARSDRNGFHEISWIKNEFVFTCVSDLDPVELNAFVELMRS
jgi:anti-sigma factor RsiW